MKGRQATAGRYAKALFMLTSEAGTAEAAASELEQFQDAARFIHFGDDLGSDGVLLSMLMIPHKPLIIEAHGKDQETLALICRCAAALDYAVFEPESVEAARALDANGPAEYAAAA